MGRKSPKCRRTRSSSSSILSPPPTLGSLTMAAGSTLDLTSGEAEFNSLSGNGSILLGNGGLALLGNNNPSGTFAGPLTGPGGLSCSAAAVL